MRFHRNQIDVLKYSESILEKCTEHCSNSVMSFYYLLQTSWLFVRWILSSMEHTQYFHYWKSVALLFHAPAHQYNWHRVLPVQCHMIIKLVPSAPPKVRAEMFNVLSLKLKSLVYYTHVHHVCVKRHPQSGMPRSLSWQVICRPHPHIFFSSPTLYRDNDAA